MAVPARPLTKAKQRANQRKVRAAPKPASSSAGASGACAAARKPNTAIPASRVSSRFIFRQAASIRARVSAGSPRALLTGSTRSAAMMLMQNGTITSTKEKSPNSNAGRLRTNSSEARKCAPEVATGPEVESP